MLNDESGMKGLIWQKIQELFSSLPDEAADQDAPKPEGEALEIETPDKASL